MGKSEESIDAGNSLKPALAKGILRCFGATTIDEYRKYIEKDPALARRFQSMMVVEPNVEETITILRGLRKNMKYIMEFGFQIPLLLLLPRILIDILRIDFFQIKL